MEHEHKRLGLKLVVKDDLRQGDLERWSAAIREHEPKGNLISNRERAGALLRSAIKVGVATASTPGTPSLRPVDVADLPPQWVNWYAQYLSKIYAEADAIPPE